MKKINFEFTNYEVEDNVYEEANKEAAIIDKYLADTNASHKVADALIDEWERKYNAKVSKNSYR